MESVISVLIVVSLMGYILSSFITSMYINADNCYEGNRWIFQLIFYICAILLFAVNLVAAFNGYDILLIVQKA